MTENNFSASGYKLWFQTKGVQVYSQRKSFQGIKVMKINTDWDTILGPHVKKLYSCTVQQSMKYKSKEFLSNPMSKRKWREGQTPKQKNKT